MIERDRTLPNRPTEVSGASRAMVKSLKVDQPVILIELVSGHCGRTMTGEVGGEPPGDGPTDLGEEGFLSPMWNEVNEGRAHGPRVTVQPGTGEESCSLALLLGQLQGPRVVSGEGSRDLHVQGLHEASPIDLFHKISAP